jgi:hypothetical protein
MGARLQGCGRKPPGAIGGEAITAHDVVDVRESRRIEPSPNTVMGFPAKSRGKLVMAISGTGGAK